MYADLFTIGLTFLLGNKLGGVQLLKKQSLKLDFLVPQPSPLLAVEAFFCLLIGRLQQSRLRGLCDSVFLNQVPFRLRIISLDLVSESFDLPTMTTLRKSSSCRLSNWWRTPSICSLEFSCTCGQYSLLRALPLGSCLDPLPELSNVRGRTFAVKIFLCFGAIASEASLKSQIDGALNALFSHFLFIVVIIRNQICHKCQWTITIFNFFQKNQVIGLNSVYLRFKYQIFFSIQLQMML